MNVLQRLVSLNQENVSEKPSNKFESISNVRKLRIICSDPYATDSSEDDGIFSKNGKRFVHEIHLPNGSQRASNASVTEGNKVTQNPARRKALGFRTKKPSLNSRKYRGIRQRKWGKWAAEIRDPVQQKRIWLGTYRSAEEAMMAYETKRIEFEALVTSMGCGEEKISCSVVLSKCANDQNHILADVSAPVDLNISTVSRAPHFSPPLVVALDPSMLDLGTNSMENEVTRMANVVEKEFTESEPMDKEFMALAQTGKELDLELEFHSIMIDGDDFTKPIDDFANGFEDLLICGLLDEDNPGILPDFDFNFDFEDYCEAFPRMNEAPSLTNGTSPLNIACP